MLTGTNNVQSTLASCVLYQVPGMLHRCCSVIWHHTSVAFRFPLHSQAQLCNPSPAFTPQNPRDQNLHTMCCTAEIGHTAKYRWLGDTMIQVWGCRQLIALRSCLPDWSFVKVKINKNPSRAQEIQNRSDAMRPFKNSWCHDSWRLVL